MSVARKTAIGGVFSAPLSRSWGPASGPVSIFQTVSEEKFLRSWTSALRSSKKFACVPPRGGEEARGAAPSLGPINGMGLGRWGFFEQLVTLSRRFALITFDVGERDACRGLP